MIYLCSRRIFRFYLNYSLNYNKMMTKMQRLTMSMLRATNSILLHPANSWGRWASLCGSRGVLVEDLVHGPAPCPDHAALTPPDIVGNLPSDLAQWHLSEVRN